MSMRILVPFLALAAAALTLPACSPSAPQNQEAAQQQAQATPEDRAPAVDHADHAPPADSADHADHAAPADASEHDHHDGHAMSEPVALPDTPWATDPPLRANMRLIRSAVDTLEHYEHGHIDAAQAATLGTDIQNAVNTMFAECKLEAEADAALHGLLATFMVGAKAVRTEAEPPAQAIAQMREALALYPQMFDDPQWPQDAQ
ncbi:MAG: hypothetical protein M9960_05935 [Xanthomonadaceae bacterium]|nr:hypothetical protein [Xanthomonadaceae bacterium]